MVITIGVVITNHYAKGLCFVRQFYDHFKQQHVDPLLLTSTSGRATATCLCLLTPDGERTMRTHLGASSELESADQLPKGWTANCRLLHCEGYCLYKPGLTRGAMQAAKAAGAEVWRHFIHCWLALCSMKKMQSNSMSLLYRSSSHGNYIQQYHVKSFLAATLVPSNDCVLIAWWGLYCFYKQQSFAAVKTSSPLIVIYVTGHCRLSTNTIAREQCATPPACAFLCCMSCISDQAMQKLYSDAGVSGHCKL